MITSARPMKKPNLLRLWSALPDAGLRFALAAPRRASRAAQRVGQARPTRKAVAATHKRSLRFMKEIWHRARAPFKSVALGPDGKPAPVDPPFQSHP